MRKIFSMLTTAICLNFMACDSKKTPDYSHTENEGNSPAANRSSDSTIYTPPDDAGSQGTNARPDSVSRTVDSMSGGH